MSRLSNRSMSNSVSNSVTNSLTHTMSNSIVESAINIVSEGTRIEGKIHFDQITRVHGVLIGEVHAADGSRLILGETSVVEGSIHADDLHIDGYVKGEIQARTRVTLARTGRVVGNIRSPSLVMNFGAFFDGKCVMEHLAPEAESESEKTVPIEPLN